ncbi:MAG TPA: TatD family nuclease-associated radical SAM protein [Clostridia bacterium]|jgi:TatD family-associated radical SAM protein
MNNYVYEYGNKLYINLTNQCSNNCAFCIRNNTDELNGYNLWLEKEPEAQEVIDLLKDKDLSKYPEIVFCGFGEPTYRLDQLVKIGQYIKSRGARTRLDTNGQGSLINNYDIVPSLKGAIDKVSISLNQYNSKDYDKICLSVYGEQGFYAMIEFAKSCKNAGIETRFTLVDVIPQEDIEKCKQLAQSLGIELEIRSFIE